MRCSLRMLIVSTLLLSIALISRPAAQTAVAQAPGVLLEGTITVNYGTPQSGIGPELVVVRLTTDAGVEYELSFAPGVLENAGGLTALHMRHVRAQGAVSAGDGVLPAFHVTAVTRDSVADVQPAIIGSQPWVTVLCKFADFPALESFPHSYFVNLMSSSRPGLDHYWREQSYDVANILGSAVAGWYTLPQPRSYYVYDRNGDGREDLDFTRSATDCATVADADVHFPSFVGVNFAFNRDLDCCAWGGGTVLNIDGQQKVYRSTWMPPWSQQRPTFAHEMGHGFGLPHSSGPYGFTYDSLWDPMSTGSKTDASCSCSVPPHTITYHKDILGWIPPARKYTAPPNSNQTITIERLALPTGGGTYLMAQIPIGSSTNNFYTVEARRFVGYDTSVPGEGIVLHNVLSPRPTGAPGTPGSPANVVDADNNRNTNDAGAMWIPGETFIDLPNNIGVRVNSMDATSYSVTIVRGLFTTTTAVTFGRQGGMRTVTVGAALSGLPWTAVANDPWITVTGGSGSGSGSFTITVAPSAIFRRGTVTVGGQTIVVTQPTIAGDLLGAGKASLANYRPSTGNWYVNGVASPTLWGGQPGDIPVAADYNGDGIVDVAIFRPRIGAWFIRETGIADAPADVVTWGALGDIPVPGDYNGDGRADIAVYRPSTGGWYVKDQFGVLWGRGTDIPVPGDYNGDGITDIAVYRRAEGRWYVMNQSTTDWGAPGDLPVPADYDGNGTTDIAVFRPGVGAWYVRNGVAGYWGAGGDIPVPLDFNGDGRAEFGIFRPSTGVWYVLNPVNGSTQTAVVGLGGDLPVVPRPLLPLPVAGDTEGDRRPEMTVYRPSTGVWWSLLSSGGFSSHTTTLWGSQPGDQPVMSDYDGDGRADLAIFRPGIARWYILQSFTGAGAAEDFGANGDTAVPGDYLGAGRSQPAVFRTTTGQWLIRGGPTVTWGVDGDVPIQADYDGDGRTDIAVFRPSTGRWYIKTSTSEFAGHITRDWGLPNDVPAPADYDNDGRADLAVFRPSTGLWVILLSSTGYASYVTHTWGANGDIPVAGDYNGDGVVDITVFRPSIGRWYVKDFLYRDWGANGDVPVPQRPQ